jgi:hypothetical protein
MPEFHRPKYVYVEQGGPNVFAIISAVVVLVAVIAIVRFIEHYAEAIFFALMGLSAAMGAGILVYLRWQARHTASGQPVLARHNPEWVTAAPAAPRPVQGRSAPRAVEAPKLTPSMVALARAIDDVQRAS